MYISVLVAEDSERRSTVTHDDSVSYGITRSLHLACCTFITTTHLFTCLLISKHVTFQCLRCPSSRAFKQHTAPVSLSSMNDCDRLLPSFSHNADSSHTAEEPRPRSGTKNSIPLRHSVHHFHIFGVRAEKVGGGKRAKCGLSFRSQWPVSRSVVKRSNISEM